MHQQCFVCKCWIALCSPVAEKITSGLSLFATVTMCDNVSMFGKVCAYWEPICSELDGEIVFILGECISGVAHTSPINVV